MLVFTEATPNPNALKLLPQTRLTDGPRRRLVRGQAQGSPLAERLFEVEGIEEVFVAEDFVTVTRAEAAEAWATLKVRVIAALADFLDEAAPALSETGEATASASGIEGRIQAVLGTRVRPYVAGHGGDIRIARFEPRTGTLLVVLSGACGGCPSARLTLKAGVEKLVMEAVPEVRRVEEAGKEAEIETAKRGPGIKPLFTYRGRKLASERS
ncbi:MAG: NifU family protein [Phenylobacterium sp.]|nr:NifU family protein [Phenylobacterium sp.]